jgi:hypothetical protein
MRVALALLAAILAAPAFADEVDPGTGSELRAVITRQIEAFGRDDAATAESFASPGIRSKFGDAATFLQMVHRAYQPLINPRSTKFDPPKPGPDGGIVQTVAIVAADGSVWTAVYSFDQIEGRWQITGCILLHAPETSA